MNLKLSSWERTTDAPILSMPAGDALRRAASQAPDRLALIEAAPDGMASLVGAARTDRRWTWAELERDALACAGWLAARFAQGERICLWAPNVPEWVILQFGAALAGLVLATANPALRAGELRHVLRRSGAVALFHAGSFRGSDMAAIAAEAAPEDDDAAPRRFLLRELSAMTGGADADHPLPQVSPDAPAQIQFTSGTSGQPKGALLRHRSLTTNAALVAARFGQSGDVVLTPMPLFHTAGSVLGVLGAATTASTLVLPAMFDPALMLDLAERERAALLYGVPTMLSALLERQTATPRDLSSLRLAVSGGAPVPAELCRRVEAAFGAPVVSVYGQTELSPIVCATEASDSAVDRAETAGRPLPQVDLRIADPDTGAPVAIGEEGEIQARGYQTMIAYVDQPEATARTLDKDGWLRTGDLGRMDARGYVRVTGRLSDMIIRGGENIYPVEVENTLVTHPAVAQAAVFGVPDDHWGEVVGAAISIMDGMQPPSVDELRRHCRAALAPHKTPALWIFTDAFPMTASGKIQKFALRDQVTSGALAPAG